MIIKDIKGGKLALTATVLREVSGASIPGHNWALKLKDLKEAFPKEQRPVLYRYSSTYGDMRGHIFYNPRSRRIGCRYFDAETFKLIRKAIREAVKK